MMGENQLTDYTEWIITHDATKGDMAYAMECTRCGVIQRTQTPIQISLWSAIAFMKLHSGCVETEEVK